MNKSIALVMAALLFVVLGCNLDRFTSSNETNTASPETTPSATDGGDSTSTDSSDTSDSDSSSSDSAATSDISIDKFNKIELGMSYDDVKGIMGSEGTQTSMTKSGSYESVSYDWKGDKFARVMVRFQNGDLVYKSQSGLTPSEGTAEIDQAKFNKINTGMSYEEVKGIIGSDGEMTSISKIGNSVSSSYRWKGEKYSNIFANFRDDKLTNKTQSGLK